MILCAAQPRVREILLAAYDLGMMERGDYVFFNMELFTRYVRDAPVIYRIYLCVVSYLCQRYRVSHNGMSFSRQLKMKEKRNLHNKTRLLYY